MEWSSPSCISSAKDPGPRGLFPAAPLLECKVYPSSGSSSLTQAYKRGKRKVKAGCECGASTQLLSLRGRNGVEIMRTIFSFLFWTFKYD